MTVNSAGLFSGAVTSGAWVVSALPLLGLFAGSAGKLPLPSSVGSAIIVLSPPATVSFGEKLEGLELLEVSPVTETSGAPSFDGVGVGVGVGAVILTAGAEFVLTAAGGGAGAGVGVGAGVGAEAGAEAVALAVGGVYKPLLAEALALLEVPPGDDAV